jgi:ABC-type phosphate/phosphonate transport system substrate-binding protein
MIANARMYSVTSSVAEAWRSLFSNVSRHAGVAVDWLEYPAPAPLEDLWRRADCAAVFMCGLPFSRQLFSAQLLAAPVPSPDEFAHRPMYWSEFVVRRDRHFDQLEDSFGGRLALTDVGSQSGFGAALELLQAHAGARGTPPYQTLIEPQITPRGAIAAVLESRADIAPVDSYAWALLQRHQPQLLAPLKSIARSRATPIPLIVAAPGQFRPSFQQALLTAHEQAENHALLETLLLERFALPAPGDYDELRLQFERSRAFWRERPLAATMHPAFV